MNYGFRVLTPPTFEPVSLSEAKAHCRVTDSEEDGLLAGYLLAARQDVERITGLLLAQQTVEMTLDAFPDGELELARAPAVSVTSVSYVDAAGANQTFTGFVLDRNRLRPALRLAFNSSWPATRKQPNAVTITYVAGYAATEVSQIEPLRQAILLMVGHWFAHREAVTTGTVNEVPLAVDHLLARYRTFFL